MKPVHLLASLCLSILTSLAAGTIGVDALTGLAGIRKDQFAVAAMMIAG